MCVLVRELDMPCGVGRNRWNIQEHTLTLSPKCSYTQRQRKQQEAPSHTLTSALTHNGSIPASNPPHFQCDSL